MTDPELPQFQICACPGAPPLTVVIPAFDEEKSIAMLLQRVALAPYDKQIIVVDDGSNDRTFAIVEQWQAQMRAAIVLLRHPRNRGKGAAVRTGLAAASGAILLIQDADLEYDPRDYPALVEPLLDGTADVAYGSRYISRRIRDAWTMNRIGVWILNLAVRALYGCKLTDEATCYKAFRTEVLRRMDLQCNGFDFCPEVTAKACRLGLQIVEVPVRYRPRSRREGKKIRWRDGWAALRALCRWRRWEPDAGAGDGAKGAGGRCESRRTAPTGQPPFRL